MKKVLFFVVALCCTVMMSAETTRLYCKMAQDWWKADGAAVGFYAFNDGNVKNAEWPGVRMTPVDGEADMWYIDVDLSLYKAILFTRVKPDDPIADWGAKTGDLLVSEIGANNLYTITSATAVWGDPGCEGVWSKYDVGSGIDHIVGNAAMVKVIENGVLYIYRNGVKFDAQGKVVR